MVKRVSRIIVLGIAPDQYTPEETEFNPEDVEIFKATYYRHQQNNHIKISLNGISARN